MLFNSVEFLFGFLPVVLGLFLLLEGRPRLAMLWLLVASVGFYAWWDARFVPVLLASMLVNYGLGLRIMSAQGRARRAWVAAGVTLNLLVLGWFKYANFGVRVLGDLGLGPDHWTHVVLPIGISFITFQKIAWLVDCYRERPAQRDPLRFGVFVAFFPQLIAGPIVHHHELMPQLGRARTDRWGDLAWGLALFTLGLAKKLLLADTVAPYSTAMFTQAATGTAPGLAHAWVGVLAYTLQIYLDFSAYSDMAIGLARMFGIQLPVNFASPYKARSIIEFWRRWHITLSRFLRDYVYVSLGGNRRGARRQKINLFLTMLLGGFWHGANWTFALWGAMHGLYLLVNHAWAGTAAARRLNASRSWRIVATLLTLLCVVVAWVPFRADNLQSTVVVWQSMLGLHGLRGADAQAALPKAGVWLALLILLAACMRMPSALELVRHGRLGGASAGYPASDIAAQPAGAWAIRLNLRWAVLIGVLLASAVMKINDVSEFIYFQF